jgi:hypothetical protein
MEPFKFWFRVTRCTGCELGCHALIYLTVAYLLQEFWRLYLLLLLTARKFLPSVPIIFKQRIWSEKTQKLSIIQMVEYKY